MKEQWFSSVRDIWLVNAKSTNDGWKIWFANNQWIITCQKFVGKFELVLTTFFFIWM